MVRLPEIECKRELSNRRIRMSGMDTEKFLITGFDRVMNERNAEVTAATPLPETLLSENSLSLSQKHSLLYFFFFFVICTIKSISAGHHCSVRYQRIAVCNTYFYRVKIRFRFVYRR